MNPIFQLGQQGSKSVLWNALQAIFEQGSDVLQDVENARINTLVAFENRLSSINGRRLRANRIPVSGSYGSFLTSDFTGIDQGQTTATVRSDSSSVSLREKAQPLKIVVRSKTFSTSVGSADAMDPNGVLYRVTTDGTIPVGTFDIELRTPLSLSLLIFDIASSPSSPTIDVSTSADGISYVEAVEVSMSGYRCNAILASTEVRYVRIAVTPTHPDDLSGTSFTFGITSFIGTGVEYSLQSDFVSKPLVFTPNTAQLVLASTDTDPRISYFLSLQFNNSVLPAEVSLGEAVDIPGVTVVDNSDTTFVVPQETVFANNLVVTSGEYIRPTTPNGFVYVVSVPGQLQATGQPTWPLTPGTPIVSNTATMVTYPDQTYLADTAYLSSMLVRPTAYNGYIYAVTVAGTSQSSGEPVWPTTPGATIVSGGITFTCQIDGRIAHVLPATVYLNTLRVLDEGTQSFLRVAPELTMGSNTHFLVNPYIVLEQQMDSTYFIYYVKYNPATSLGKTFTISYVDGPSAVTAVLRVRLNTEDHSSTPVFHGAQLQQV